VTPRHWLRIFRWGGDSSEVVSAPQLEAWLCDLPSEGNVVALVGQEHLTDLVRSIFLELACP